MPAKCTHPRPPGRERASIKGAEQGLSGAGGGSGFAELGGDPVEAVEDAGAFALVSQQQQAGLGEVVGVGGRLDELGEEFFPGEQVGHGEVRHFH